MKEALQMFQISSTPNSISLIEQFVQSIVKLENLNECQHGDILVSLTEAVNNAIFHGNKCIEYKKVSISYKSQRNKLFFRVSDEGRGFDPKSIPDPTHADNITTIGGRGVFIMKQLAQDIIYKNNGSTVEMVFVK